MDTLSIKTNELIKKAFEFWDIKDWDIDEIDPVVKLLFAACANESLLIDKYFNKSATVTYTSLLNSFLPFSLSGPKPACAMIQALPVESQIKLNDKINFEFEKIITTKGKRENTIIPFTPAFDATLFNISTRYSFCFDRLVALPDHDITNTEKNAESQNSIWLGLKMDDSISSLDGLSIFFSLKQSELKENKPSDYDFFDSVKLFTDNKELSLNKPIAPEQYYQFKDIDPQKFSYNFASYSDLLFDTLNFYNDFYFQIRDSDKQKTHFHKKKYPDFFRNLVGTDVLEQFTEDLTWLEFRFDAVQSDVLKNVDIYLNAFPVINHKQLTFNLDKEEPVVKIPLTTEEDLIGATNYRIFDEYHNQINSSQATQLPFLIRDMEMEKFSKRDLFDLVEEMIDRFTSDNHAFREEFKIDVDDMNKLREALIPVFAAKMKFKKSINKRNIYALYNTGNNKEITSTELACSITNGAYANRISAGEKLQTSNAQINQNEIVFLTKTINGRNRMSSEEKTTEVKRLMLSGDRIITNTDIKDFCYSLLGTDIKSIALNNSAYKDKKGLRKCILVNIILNKDNIEEDDLILLTRSIENRIKTKSNIVLPVKLNLTTE